jgi:hypothetical protein
MSEPIKQYEDQITNAPVKQDDQITNEPVKQDDQITNEPVKQDDQITNEPVKQNDSVTNESVKQDDHDLKVPDNLKPVERIFLRPFAGVYYDEHNNLFYSTRTARRTRTFCPIKWAHIKYAYLRGKKEGPRYIKKIYNYVTVPVGNGNYFKLSEKEWEDWVKTNKTNELNLE